MSLNKMKIALIGYGKMGRLIEEVAQRHGIETVARFTSSHPLRVGAEARAALQEVDALIDFSIPATVLENIRLAAALSLNLIVGTTGWNNQLDEARKAVEDGNIGLVYGSNFSLGVNLFCQLVERAAQLFSAFENYDPFVVRIKAMITTQAGIREVINLSLQNVVANNSNGQSLTIMPQSSRLEVLTTAVASKHETPVITAYQLHQNYPNPFNPNSLIRYEIPRSGSVVVKVYNFIGQEVRTLVNQVQSPGAYQISWGGRDEQGQEVPSGIYLYRLQAASFVETRKMTLLR